MCRTLPHLLTRTAAPPAAESATPRRARFASFPCPVPRIQIQLQILRVRPPCSRRRGPPGESSGSELLAPAPFSPPQLPLSHVGRGLRPRPKTRGPCAPRRKLCVARSRGSVVGRRPPAVCGARQGLHLGGDNGSIPFATGSSAPLLCPPIGATPFAIIKRFKSDSKKFTTQNLPVVTCPGRKYVW